MIVVDETDPVGENESPFPTREVKFSRGKDANEFYNLISEIGRGKFGTVYKCQEKATNLQLAAKFVPIPKRGDRRNVEREVEIMNSLQHHLIIQLYDAFEYQKMMCVVLELIEGGELFERVIDDDFILTERACVVFVRQICEAMEFVHRKQILHLDLKPENILCLTRTGNRIKLIDFGLARKFDPEKKLQVLFGTPEFVAPEIVNFDSISFGTDMWSVGVICYVLLSGLSPFMGETDIETMANVTISKYDFDDEAFHSVSPDVIDFISKLLIKKQDERMSASECLEHKWLRRASARRPSLPPKPTSIVPKVAIKITELEDAPPPLPKMPPPPPPPPSDMLLSELSCPIVVMATVTPPILPQILTQSDEIIDECLPIEVDRLDKELDVTKDNLKSFVERRDEQPPVPYEFDGESHFIAPVRPDNDPPASPPAIPNHPSTLPPPALPSSPPPSLPSSPAPTPMVLDDNVTYNPEDAIKARERDENEKNKKSSSALDTKLETKKEDEIGLDELPKRNTITQNLLEQLEQIQIRDRPTDGDGASPTNTPNNGKYLQVISQQAKNNNGDSQLSSRGCSPSPCDSLTSSADTAERKTDLDTFDEQTTNGEKFSSSSTEPASQMLRDYLHSFDRRNSDSNYVMGTNKNPNNSLEKLDLVDEIRRLSDHLMMLNSLKAEITDATTTNDSAKPTQFVRSVSCNERGLQTEEIKITDKGILKAREEKEKAKSKGVGKTSPLLDQQANLKSKLDSKIVKSQIMKFSNSVENGTSRVSSSSVVQTKSMTFNSRTSSLSSSVRTATKLIETTHPAPTKSQTPPWMMKCKRTKFRVNEMSRDVPFKSPDSHQDVLIEEQATTTKDCLLHLLDKYSQHNGDTSKKNHDELVPSSASSSSSTSSISSFQQTVNGKVNEDKSEKRTSMIQNFEDHDFDSSDLLKNIPRHFSLSLDWHLNDSLENSSMNSINAFFQSHSTRVGSSLVKQIQQQIEAKNVKK